MSALPEDLDKAQPEGGATLTTGEYTGNVRLTTNLMLISHTHTLTRHKPSIIDLESVNKLALNKYLWDWIKHKLNASEKLLEHGFLVILNSRKIVKVGKAVIVPGGLIALAMCNGLLTTIHTLLYITWTTD